MNMVSIFRFSILLAIPVFAQTNMSVNWAKVKLDQSYLRSEWIPNQSELFLSNDNHSVCDIFNVINDELISIPLLEINAFGAKWSPDGNQLLILQIKYQNKRRLNSLIIVDRNGNFVKTIVGYTTKKITPIGWSSMNSAHYLLNKKLHSHSIKESMIEWSYPVIYAIGNKLFKKENVSPAILLREFSSNLLNITTSYTSSLVAFEEYGGHLWVTDPSTGLIKEIGPGNAPSISPNGDFILFMMLEDDGYELTKGDIYYWNRKTDLITQLSFTDDRIEMNPSISADGKFISATTYPDGQLLIGTIR